MKKLMVIFALAFLLTLSFNNNSMAQEDETWIEIRIYKNQYFDSVDYEFVFDFDGHPVNMENVNRVLLKIPNGKRMLWRNSLRVDDFVLGSGEMTYEKLKNKFPEGKYKVIFFPRRLGSLEVNMPHWFPQTPNIKNLSDGETNVPLNLEIEWNPQDNVGEWVLEIEKLDENATVIEEELSLILPSNATSFEVPNGFLQPDTEYELNLSAHIWVDADPYQGSLRIVGGMNGELVSSRIIYFTTGY